MSDTPLPTVVEIEPTAACNIRCRMCHVSFMPEMSRPLLDPALVRKLAPVRDAHFIIASGFEPTMHPELPEILTILAGFGAAYEVLTNGTILTDHLLAALVAGNVKLITFSFDGITKAIYEHIRRGADYDQTLRNIRRVRDAFRDRDTLFAVNNTIMRCNLEEIPASVGFWEEREIHLVRFISMVIRERDPWLLRESLYPVRDRYYRLLEQACCDVIENQRRIGVHSQQLAATGIPQRYPEHCRDLTLHSDNPQSRRIPVYRSLTQVGEYPGMWFGCRSPWTFAKIMNNGAVQLCYRFTIGNLNVASFEEIWNGPLATAVRERVKADRALCPKCDYFRFCLSNAASGESIEQYFAGSLFPLVDRVNFSTGEISGAPQEVGLEMRDELLPRLIHEGHDGFNIVQFREKYFALAQSLGSLDVAQIDETWLAGRTQHEALVSRSLADLYRRIDDLPEPTAAAAIVPEPVPQLVQEGRRGFNIVEFQGVHFALARSLGPIDVAQIDETWLAGRTPHEALVSRNMDDLTRQIDELPELPESPRRQRPRWLEKLRPRTRLENALSKMKSQVLSTRRSDDRDNDSRG